MHVFGLLWPLDLNLFLQFFFTALIVVVGLLYFVKNTASKYFVVDASFDSSSSSSSSSASASPSPFEDTDINIRKNSNSSSMGLTENNACVVCSKPSPRRCSGCKLVRYCSEACQRSDWNSGHSKKCKKFKSSGKTTSTAVSVIPASKAKNLNGPKEVLFPYEEFVRLYNWEKPGFPPCGLLNCGNSCFANVVLQCLACTRPLVAYLLERGHQRICRRNEWCFMCEFQSHMERATQTLQPFSPINILSRLPNIGGNLGYGKQEDAHEFMRFAIDTMQSVCLDEYGGEKAVHPIAKETTFIQHIFGGQLQSQVTCTKCSNVSNQFENMMDLIVEIQGDAASLEECLDQFTIAERLHGDNMYKCDGCNDYVLAWKRLTIRRAPNILTIALKRFQSGRFGKLNKRVNFPETLDLSPYMSEVGDEGHVYKLYAVVVHVDMLNASYFGHYICYTKDFSGNWYRVDDCEVHRVELEEVLSQGAYMLLYSRVSVKPSRFNPMEPVRKLVKEKSEVDHEVLPCANGSLSMVESVDIHPVPNHILSNMSSQSIVSGYEEEMSSVTEDVKEDPDMVDSEVSSSVSKDIEVNESRGSNEVEESVSARGDFPFPEVNPSSISGAFVVENLEPPFPDTNDENKKKADGSVVVRPSDNGVCENWEALRDVPVSALSTGEVLNQSHPSSSSGEMQEVESAKGLPSSYCTDNAVGKSDGRKLLRSKSKPLFSPGFLGVHPRKKYSEQEAKAPAEVGEVASACNLNGESNTYAEPDLSSLNEEGIRDGTPHISSDFNEKHAVNSRSEDQMVTSQYSESDDPCSGASISLNIKQGNSDLVSNRSLVQSQTPLHDGGSVAISNEFLDEGYPYKSSGKPDKVEIGKGIPTFQGIDDVESGEIKRERTSSQSKSKPLLHRGFLGKHPREKYSKKEVDAPTEIGNKLGSAYNLNGRNNRPAQLKESTEDGEGRCGNNNSFSTVSRDNSLVANCNNTIENHSSLALKQTSSCDREENFLQDGELVN